jgi:hypothetical protein
VKTKADLRKFKERVESLVIQVGEGLANSSSACHQHGKALQGNAMFSLAVVCFSGIVE